MKKSHANSHVSVWAQISLFFQTLIHYNFWNGIRCRNLWIKHIDGWSVVNTQKYKLITITICEVVTCDLGREVRREPNSLLFARCDEPRREHSFYSLAIARVVARCYVCRGVRRGSRSLLHAKAISLGFYSRN